MGYVFRAYEESQFQTQFAGLLDTIPEFFPVLERAPQPLEPHLLCCLLPSKTPHQQRPRWRIALSESSGIAPASTLLRVHRAKRQIVQSCRADYKMSFARERRSRRSWINRFCAMKRVGCAIRICFGPSKGNPFARDNSTFHGEPSRRST